MNWAKVLRERIRAANQSFPDMDKATSAVQRSLMALKYLKPDIDPTTCDFQQLMADLTETGTVPTGVDVGRFAAMVVFYARHRDQMGEI